MCKQFMYSGCGGNKNNFKTIQECVDMCGNKIITNIAFNNWIRFKMS